MKDLYDIDKYLDNSGELDGLLRRHIMERIQPKDISEYYELAQLYEYQGELWLQRELLMKLVVMAELAANN